MSETPTFAVVGHPNKGKSSIVSTLAHDDSVRIAPESGTTTRCREYPMQVDGVVQYVLVDTPGFQRARRALAWMRERETTAALHRRVVEEFVDAHAGGDVFEDECELLRPLLDGAGILYVVDGSIPYGPEYEAEMEILRWTGQPSLALINPIQSDEFVGVWRSALEQYFKVVRVFDALQAPFEARLELLRAFGQLREAWRDPLERAVVALARERDAQHRRAGREVAEMLADMLSLSVERRLPPEDDPERHREALEADYRDRLRAREKRGREAVEATYGRHRLERRERGVSLADPDLFSEDEWFLWGLNRRQLGTAGAAGGAVVGGLVDAGLGGATFLLGSAIGAAVGGIGALVSGQRLQRTEVLRLPLGGHRLRCGPTTSLTFPYVVLGRALDHQARIAGRTHADRRALELSEVETDSWVDDLPNEQRRGLEKLFRRMRGGERRGPIVGDFVELVLPLLRGEGRGGEPVP